MASFDIKQRLIELNVLTGNFIYAAPKTKEIAERQALMNEIVDYINGIEERIAYLEGTRDDE